MTIKLIGAAAIIISSWVAGIMFSMKSAYRLEDLEEFKKAVSIFSDSISLSAPPISEIFKDISKRVNGPVAMIFDDAGKMAEGKNYPSAEEIFKNAVDKNIKNLYFEAGEMDCLYSFGKNLDLEYSHEQKNGASIIISNINLNQKALKEQAEKDKRLYSSAGVLCGILMCVILF